MIDYLQSEKERLEKLHAEIQHDIERQEQRAEFKKMIDDAIRELDQKIQIEIQTKLNGKNVPLNDLAIEIREKLITDLQRAFK